MAEDIACPPPLMSPFTGLTAGKFPLLRCGGHPLSSAADVGASTVEKPRRVSDQAGGALCVAK